MTDVKATQTYDTTFNTSLKQLLAANTDPLVEAKDFRSGKGGEFDPKRKRYIAIANAVLKTKNPELIAAVTLHELTHYADYNFNGNKNPYAKTWVNLGVFKNDVWAREEADFAVITFFGKDFRKDLPTWGDE